MIKATRNIILVEDIQETGGFSVPAQNGELHKAKVISAGDFVWHICHEKIYCPVSEGDIIYFVFNGNERIPGTNQYLIIFDQVRGVVTE
jgi:co-chaperonin GroES (HSP10)